MLPEIIEALSPLLLEAIAALLTLLLGWLAVKANALIGVKIEEKHMNALHSAIMTGIRRAMNGNLSRTEIINEALRYAQRSVPDAIRFLVKEDGVLWQLAESKLEEILGRPARSRTMDGRGGFVAQMHPSEGVLK